MQSTWREAAAAAARHGQVPRTAALAALCVLLPLFGQAGVARHLPGGVGLAVFTVVAVGASFLWGRRPLSQRQTLAALLSSQAAFHAAYTLPGACAAAGLRESAVWFEHATGPGHSAWEAVAGHAVAVLIAVRALGAGRSLLRPLAMLARAARERFGLRTPCVLRSMPVVPRVLAARSGWVPTGFRAPPRVPARAPPSPRLFSHLSLRPAPAGGACLG